MSHKAASLAITGFFLSAVIVLGALSAHGRSYAPAEPGTMLVMYAAEPRDTLGLWRAQGVRGRVLVVFGRLGANDSGGAPDDLTYQYHAISEGIVRAVYHVVPDGRWERTEARLAEERAQFRAQGAVFRGTVKGAPLIVSRLADLPRLTEPALVVIQGGYWPGDEIEPVITALKSSSIPADMIVVTGDGHDAIMSALGAR